MRFPIVPQPPLPDLEIIEADGAPWVWPKSTVSWWAKWGDEPLASSFTDLDWQALVDTAYLRSVWLLSDPDVADSWIPREVNARIDSFAVSDHGKRHLRIRFGFRVPPEDTE